MNRSGGQRFQFRLRTILFLVAVVGLVMAWISYEREQTRRRAQAVRVISSAGGWATDNDETVSWLDKFRAFLGGDYDGPVIAICLSKRPFVDSNLAQLKPLKNVRWLELDQTKISDAGLVHLEEFTELHYLDLSGTQVSDAGVNKLKLALPSITIIR